MKGKATFILADAKTGEVISRTEEHNLVTNAVENIFNLPHYMQLHGFNNSKLFTTGLPLWNDLMGGIMLLGNTVEESADNIVLGPDTVPIATAGSEYDGESTTRGTLNLNESCRTENGYRLTWDFGTDKANGLIKCVGLTSKEFGNTGFFSENTASGSFAVLPQKIGTTNASPEGAFEYGAGQYLGTFEPLTHLFAELNDDGDLVLRRYRSLDPLSVYINSEAGLTAVSEPISEKIVTPPITLKYDHDIFLDTDNMKVQYFAPVVNNSDGTMTVSYTELDIETLTFGAAVSLTVPKFTYIRPSVWKEHIYFSTTGGIQCYAVDGTYKYTLTYDSGYPSFFFSHGGCLMVYYNGYVVYLSENGAERRLNYGSAIFPMYSVDAKAPYVTAATRPNHGVDWSSSSMIKPVPMIVSSYMATINNLSQPIEKSSAHTLKIIYEITN